jgi:hypothetical protein
MNPKYLDRYAEAEARAALDDPLDFSHQYCLVIPAYREDSLLADRLIRMSEVHGNLLIILVLNQPDSDPNAQANQPLRKAIAEQPTVSSHSYGTLYGMQNDGHLLLVERASALPIKEGVGLARKIGCDIALALHQQGLVTSTWLHNTDADATLPDDYFSRAENSEHYAAISHPFHHQLPADPALATAVYLYELRLHYYVLGLTWARSPYAFHTLGSCLSVRAQAYSSVRGFPRRSGGEDFYLLNKVAKLGTIATDTTSPIELQGRVSDRVPFGTGPAVAKLLEQSDPLASPLFYHPRSFHALKTLLENLQSLRQEGCAALESTMDSQACAVLRKMGIAKAIAHCSSHSDNFDAWSKHFHQWFDGFRTLKFIHGMRSEELPDLDLAASRAHPNSLWPGSWIFEEGLLKQQPANIGEN